MTTDKNESIRLIKEMERLGESRIMNNGQKATIIVYRNANDIDIRFEDGIVVEHKTYHDFQKGSISNPNYNPYSHLGESKIMNNGQKATIINYPNCMDIDIQFEDGTIVKHKTYQGFQKSYISNPNYHPYSHLGESRIMNNGMKATIIIYRNYNDIDIKFEDETIVKHKGYANFQKGKISNPKYKPYVGESRIMNNGMKATIIKYTNNQNIDIKFEDGTVVKHKQYVAFQKGNISNPNYNPHSHLGETKIMKNGMKATIINYPNYKDIDIRFEDETIVKHKHYSAFQKGFISHPDLFAYKGRISIFHNFEAKYIAGTKDAAFYKCKCLSCNIEEILTPKQMMRHEREHEKELPEEIEELEM